MKVPIHVVLALVGLSITAAAQSLPLVLQVDEPFAVSTSQVEDLGDIDGDGCDDFGYLASTPDPNNPMNTLTRSKVVSGRTGLSIHDLNPWLISSPLPLRYIKTGDLNGDGLPEFLIEQPQNHLSQHTTLNFHSGSSGAGYGSSTVPVTLAPTRIATVGDVNGDGVEDLVVAGTRDVFINTSSFLPMSYIDVIDGATRVKTNIVSYLNITLPSGGVVGVGDVDGDGLADFASSSAATSLHLAGQGTATVYSGANGANLYTWFGLLGDGLGTALVGLSDIDFDGVRELAIFSPGSDAAFQNSGRVEVVSPSTGIRLIDILPALGETFTALEEAGDHDGDGFQDLLIDVTVTATSQVRRELRSGITGAFIAFVGVNETPVGDLNGDGIDDLIGINVGQPTPGQTRYLGRSLMGARSYGTSSGSADLAWMPGSFAPAQGSLELSGAGATNSVVGVVSFAPANTVIYGTNLPLLVSDLPTDFYALYFNFSDAAGNHSDFINLGQPGLAGIRIYVQYVVLGLNPSTTNAVEILFGPS